MKKEIPNLLTLANLACGMMGIYAVFNSDLEKATYFIVPALIFDFLDGFVARLLKVSSPLGKELDSLADMVTFGALPGFIMFQLLAQASCDPKVCTGLISNQYFPYLGFLITLFSAYRLAKFNIDTRQSDTFIGLPTPANTIVIASLPLIASYQPQLWQYINHPKVLAVICLVFSYLLVAELPLIALKFKNFGLKENIYRYSVVIASVLSILLFGVAGLPLSIILYIIIAILQNFATKRS